MTETKNDEQHYAQIEKENVKLEEENKLLRGKLEKKMKKINSANLAGKVGVYAANIGSAYFPDNTMAYQKTNAILAATNVVFDIVTTVLYNADNEETRAKTRVCEWFFKGANVAFFAGSLGYDLIRGAIEQNPEGVVDAIYDISMLAQTAKDWSKIYPKSEKPTGVSFKSDWSNAFGKKKLSGKKK